jgi:mannosyltransferase
VTTTTERTASAASAPARRPLQHPLALPLLVGLLTTAIASIALTVPSIWYDEAATVASATRSWSGLWAELQTVDLVHGLYYIGMHIVFDLVGYSPFSLRFPSAIASGIAAALVVVLGRQLHSTRLGVTAGIVFALLPRVTWMGGEGRSYAFAVACATLLTVLLVHALRSGTPWAWIAYGVVVVLGVVLFIYLALIVAAHAVTVLLLRRRSPPGSLGRFALTVGATAAVLVPFAVAASAQSGQIGWLESLGTDTVRQVLRTQWFYTSTPFAIVGWVAIVLGAIVVVRRARRDVRAAVVLPALIVPTALVLVATVLAQPLYTPRYLSLSLPFVALLIGAAIAAVPLRRARVLALVVVLAFSLPQLVHQRQPETKQESAWSQVAALMDERIGTDAARTAIVWGGIQYHPLATARVIRHSYPAPFAGTIDVTLERDVDHSGALWETERPLSRSLDRLAGAESVYLITSTARDRRAVTASHLAAAGWRPVRSWSFTDLHVIEYSRFTPR